MRLETRPTLRKALKKAVSKIFVSPPDLSISEWADTYRVLSPEVSAEPGKWKTSRAPYLKEMMDVVKHRDVECVVYMTFSQSGKSECLNNISGYYIHQEPSPILMVQPTIKLAEDYSKDRIAKMIRDTPVLTELFPKAKTRISSNTILHKEFPGGNLTLAGANSPANLASRPKRILNIDEVDRMEPTKEGDAVAIAEKRTSTFYNRKHTYTSTPTDKGKSRIEKLYLGSDQRRYYVPCPYCNHKQTLHFDFLKWEKDQDGNNLPRTVKYECQGCKKLIQEKSKSRMLARGEWRAHAPFVKTAGFHINELYSPWRKWYEVVESFLVAKKSHDTLRVWVNTSKGEPYQFKGDAPSWKKLYRRREKYTIGRVPKGPLFLTAGIDIQKSSIHIEVVGWGRDLESWSIDYIVLSGDTSKAEIWRKLDTIISSVYKTHNDLEIPIKMTGIDSGYITQVVYNYARKWPHNKVIAVHGVKHQQVIIAPPRKTEVKKSGKSVRYGVKRWNVGTDILKTELYGFLKQEAVDDDGDKMMGFCHFPQYSEQYFKELTAEQLMSKVEKGYTLYYYEKVYPQNEALDCRNYARAAACLVGLDRFKEKDWERMEGDMKNQSYTVVSKKEFFEKPKQVIQPKKIEAVKESSKKSRRGDGKRRKRGDRKKQGSFWS